MKERFINFIQNSHDAHPSICAPDLITFKILNKTL